MAAKVLTNTYVDAKVYFVFCWFFLSIRVQHLFDISLANLLNFLNTSVIDVDELTELFILHKDRLEEALAKKKKRKGEIELLQQVTSADRGILHLIQYSRPDVFIFFKKIEFILLHSKVHLSMSGFKSLKMVTGEIIELTITSKSAPIKDFSYKCLGYLHPFEMLLKRGLKCL